MTEIVNHEEIKIFIVNRKLNLTFWVKIVVSIVPNFCFFLHQKISFTILNRFFSFVCFIFNQQQQQQQINSHAWYLLSVLCRWIIVVANEYHVRVSTQHTMKYKTFACIVLPMFIYLNIHSSWSENSFWIFDSINHFE